MKTPDCLPESTVLTLPYPISANRYWQSFVPKGGSRAIVVVSLEAKKFRKHVQKLAMAQGVRAPLAGPIEVTLKLYPHLPQDWARRAKVDPLWWDLTVQCIDLDNAQKVLWDALKNVAFTDDSMIRKAHSEIAIPDGEARVVVTIKPYAREHPQAGLFHVKPEYVPKRTYADVALPAEPF